MPINVGDLLKERDRLQTVLEEAKIARSRIRQINVLVAMYGDQENVTVRPVHSVVTPRKPSNDNKRTRCTNPKCKGKTFNGQAGLNMHKMRVHGSGKGNPRLRRVS